MLNNAILGLQSIGLFIKTQLIQIVLNPIILGFIFGIIASTGIHMILLGSRRPKNYIPCVLTKTAQDSFVCLAPKNEHGTYLIPYSDFLHEYNLIRIIFYTLFLALNIVIALALFLF